MPSQTSSQENSAAGVIPAAPWQIQAASVLPGHQLVITFRDGSSGSVDCSGILSSQNPGIYAPLVSPEYFAQVRVELGVLCWPNQADMNPSWVRSELRSRKE